MSGTLREQPSFGDGVVTIEPFSRRDIPAMMSWNTDTEAQRRFDWPAEVPDTASHRAHCIDVLERWQSDWTAGRRAPFVIRRSIGGEAVGSVELRLDEGKWHVSYLTHPAWRGRGIATRAVRLACDWAFSALDAADIRLVVAEDNEASRAVAGKVGFVETGERTESQPVVSFTPELGVRHSMIEYVLVRTST